MNIILSKFIANASDVIDAHVHLPSPGRPHHESFYKSVDSAIAYLVNAGIGRVVFNTWQGVFAKSTDDIGEANRAALVACDKYPGLLYPGAVISPEFPKESEYWLHEFHGMGLTWVGELVPYVHNISYSRPEFLKLFEICAGHDFILQLHQDREIITVADRFPRMKIICSHIPEDDLLIEIARRNNIWLDISGSSGGLVIGRIETAVKVMGAHKLLFGTDFDAYEPAAFIASVKRAVPDQVDRTKIFRDNLLDLINDQSAHDVNAAAAV
jgi:predicted TIM-barrel fold metal-dependent hydrolase